MKDDRTGFPQRAERIRPEWNGLAVDATVWEPRQPQDLVKGVRDDQTVPVARPLPPNVFVGPVYIQITAAAAAQATTLTLESVQGLSDGVPVDVMLATGTQFRTSIAGSPAGFVVTLADPLPYPVPSGNLLTRLTQRISV